MKWATFITMLTLSTAPMAQCLGDRCVFAIPAPPNVWLDFCNYGCLEDFQASGMDNRANLNCMTPCTDDNWEGPWFTFVSTGTYAHILIQSDHDSGEGCFRDPPLVTSYGPHEGWTFALYRNGHSNPNVMDCEGSQIIFGTNCYWMTEVCPAIITPTDWFGITEYDPSRQDWSVQIFNMAPGQRYHIQIDGHGWCMGCAQFMWQDEIINLGITPNQESILYQLLPVNHPYKMRFDSAGRLIR